MVRLTRAMKAVLIESREMLGIMPPQASVTFYVKQRCS